MRIQANPLLSIVGLSLGLTLVGCDDTAGSPDSGTSAPDGGGDVDDSGAPAPDAEVPTDGAMDGSTMVPVPEGAPGGEGSGAPIVGCEDAERPAQRDEAAVALCEAVGGGRCWYVSPEGDDANDASFEAPLRTPQEAVRQAGPGDVIYLRGGVYDDANAHDSKVVSWGDSSAGTVRGLLSIGRVSLPAWAGGTTYDVASGTPSEPITVRSFPGERACASGAGNIRVGSLSQETAYWNIENITVHQGAINIGGGTGNASDPRNQTHDIVVRGNEVYEYATSGGGNPGLVRVNRGDGGGPYAITVESNILHDLIPIDDGVTHDWRTTTDGQHFGAITTLSCETYIEDCGGNGELTIRNNHIYHVPQAFFFKNPAEGPFDISGNVIHDFGSLGQWSPSNITFDGNLVVGGGRIRLGGSGGPFDQGEVFERMGHHFTARNNTLIGVDQFLEFRVWATGHTIRGNVFSGLTTAIAERDYNHMGLIYQAEYVREVPQAADIADSQIATDNDFDDNCYVTDVTDFIAYGRRHDTGLDHLTLDEARARLGHELNSDIVGNTAEVFVDPTRGDYSSAEGGACAGRGAVVPAWALDLP